MNCSQCGTAIASSSSTCDYRCSYCNHRGNFKDEQSVVMNTEEDEASDPEDIAGASEVPPTQEKRGTKRGAEVLVPVVVSLGRQSNQLALKKRKFRFGFQNVENLTNVFFQGKSLRRDRPDSARNIVRLEFLAQTIVGLGLDAFALMEMGADAETYLRNLVERLNNACGEACWESAFSEDTGRTVAPPAEMEVTFKPYADVERRMYALGALLPYYTLVVEITGDIEAERHLFAHRLLAGLGTREAGAPMLAHIEELEQRFEEDNDLSNADIAETLREVAGLVSDDRAAMHLRLLELLDEKDSGEVSTQLRALIEQGQVALAAIYCVLTGSTISLQRNPVAIETDGPLAAIRTMEYNVGRYEKYGLVWRTGLHAPYLINELVRTELLDIGRRTNSRAAMRFRLPLGRNEYLTADILHNMWSAAPDATQDLAVREPELRIRSLCGHAEAANQETGANRPLFIFTDSNVATGNYANLNARMSSNGYTRLGDDRPTTLRQEKTLRDRDAGFDSECYDAVFQDASRQLHHPTELHYPNHLTPALCDAFLYLLGTSPEVRRWYFGMLCDIYARIIRVSKRKIPALAEHDAILSYDGDDEEVETVLCSLFQNTGTAWEKYQALHPAGEKVFVLFHRHFVSDHRMLAITMEYASVVLAERNASKRTRRHRTPLAQAIIAAGFERGHASGTRLNCFLYSLLQLTNDTEVEDHDTVALLRADMALSGIIRSQGMIDAGDPALGAWLTHNHPGYAINIYTQDNHTGALNLTWTVGNGTTSISMLLSGDHFEPLWPTGHRPP